MFCLEERNIAIVLARLRVISFSINVYKREYFSLKLDVHTSAMLEMSYTDGKLLFCH